MPLAGTVLAASTVSATLTNRGPITSVGRLESDGAASFAASLSTVSLASSGLSAAGYESGGGTPSQEE
jgi:hypothetical protein